MMIKLSINDNVYICQRDLHTLEDLKDELHTLDTVMDSSTLIYFIDSEKDKVVILCDQDLLYAIADAKSSLKLFVLQQEVDTENEVHNRARSYTFDNLKKSSNLKLMSESEESIIEPSNFQKLIEEQIAEKYLSKSWITKKKELKSQQLDYQSKWLLENSIHQIIGIFYAWPILHSYHLILMREENSSIFNFIFPLMICSMNISLPYSDKLLKYAAPNTIIVIIVCTLSMGFLAIGQLYQHVYLHIILLLFIVGPLLGLLYSIPFLSSWQYFIKQKIYLNCLYQVFIGVGAVLTLYIFESNMPQQLELFYDQNQQFCAECFNLQTRQSFKAISIWIIIIGTIAAYLIKIPEKDIADTVVDYDLLAFSHLELPQQNSTQMNEQEQIDKIEQQKRPFFQLIHTNQFKLLLSSSIYCAFIPYLFLSQFQSIEKLFGISYIESEFQYKITILIYGFAKFIHSYFFNDLELEQLVKKMYLFQVVSVIILMICTYTKYLIGLQVIGSCFIVFLSFTLSGISSQIPKIFGPQSASQIFQTILIGMGLACVVGSVIFNFIMNEQNYQRVIYVIGLKIIVGQYLILRQYQK